MDERLYYKDFYKNRWLRDLFQFLLLLTILITGAYYCENSIQIHSSQIGSTQIDSIQTTSIPKQSLKYSKKQVLGNYPILQPIKWDWSTGDYIKENTTYNKQKISDEFIEVLKNEENALDDYISSNEIIDNKNKAFLKHMNNVEAVAKNLAQVVDWIVYEELPSPQGNTTNLKTIYGIKYRFISELTYDEGEEFYTYTKVALIDYPMISMKLDYVGTELHIVASVDKGYYIKKYTGIIDDKTLELYKSMQNLSELDFREQY